MRRIIGSDDLSLVLHQELRSLTNKEQNKLLLDAGLTVDIPPEEGLAMKADLAISWNKLRVIRRLIFFKQKYIVGIQSHEYECAFTGDSAHQESHFPAKGRS